MRVGCGQVRLRAERYRALLQRVSREVTEREASLIFQCAVSLWHSNLTLLYTLIEEWTKVYYGYFGSVIQI